MKTGLILIGIVIVIGIVLFILKTSGIKKTAIQVAKQIKLDQLETVIEQLKNQTLENDFFGITSNGVDCIYFVENNGKINIEFEAMVNEQKQYIEKIKEFGKSNGYEVIMKTYGNKPRYEDLKEAPVVKIKSNLDTKASAEFGKRIMKEIFNCNDITEFDVVP